MEGEAVENSSTLLVSQLDILKQIEEEALLGLPVQT